MDLVSIIIPVYNRQDLIKETLDSILKQTYTFWECLVIDDGSSDLTAKVVDDYQKKDNRIKLFKRLDTELKGANTCRNIGLKKSNGDYIVFFDSDDLMTPNHIELKLKAIIDNACDYVITKTQYFNYKNDDLEKYYTFKDFPITIYNYISQRINWLTLDVCIKSSIAKSIEFNTSLKSGQEYNYYCKLVHKSINAVYIDEVVSLRRHHNNSIKGQLKSLKQQRASNFTKLFRTYIDLKTDLSEDVKDFFISKCVDICYDSKSIPNYTKAFVIAIVDYYKFKSIYFFLMLIRQKYFGRGYYFRKKLLNR